MTRPLTRPTFCCLLFLVVSLPAAVCVANEPAPAAHWDFENELHAEMVGAARLGGSELQAPRYPDFAAGNKVLLLHAPAWVRIPDSGSDSRFDFDNGDDVTFEAWVRVDSMNENVYLIGKGRTGTSGIRATNQNWAFRLRRTRAGACVNFLFRSRPADDHPGDWHRWTSTTGFSSGSRWHHVAVSYRFGDPDSICGFIDGQQVKGVWDMGGATTRAPVVDDDDVWIGSSMGGNKGNSLHGAIDNLRIHRRQVSAEELLSRFRWDPPPVTAPHIPHGKVAVQLFGPLDSISKFPLETEEALTEWYQDEMGFVRLPQKYDSWGVRDDWGSTALVRAWTDMELPAGEYRLLVRSRGMARLTVDGQILLTTPPQKNRAGAHHVVDDLPPVPVPGMRPHAMNDSERIVTFNSDGKRHRVLYEIIVGGPSYRLEFGETCLAIAPPDGMFHLLSQVSEYPLTDDGWQNFVNLQSARLDSMDRQARTEAGSLQDGYWDRRHIHAKQHLLQNTELASIDDLIAARIATVNEQARKQNADQQRPEASPQQQAGVDFFQNHIQPIFDAHCTRCHGEKQQGGLLISSRQRLLSGGDSGDPAIVPGVPADSYLFQLVSAPADDYRMPPKGDGLSAQELQHLQTWIADGAVMPPAPMKTIEQPPIVDDATFLRRVFLDTVGVPPTVTEARTYLTDSSADRRKQLVDRLLQDDRWADNWVGYWQDALAENPNLLKPTLNNTGPFRYWLHDALSDNKPMDRFATELIMMRGSTWGGGAAGFSIASQNDVPMAAKAHVIGSAFLGVNMKCARCHDAPYHQWKQADLFQMAAMLDRKQLKLPASSTVPAAFFEKQERRSLIEVSLTPGAEIAAHFPFAELAPVVEDSVLTDPSDTRERLAARVTGSRRFAEVIANRIWKRLMGAALVDPVDDWEGNPPTDPELLAGLADRLIRAEYDLKEFARHIFTSDVYQRQALDPPSRRERHFAGPYRRRMSAEQVVDSAFHVAGQQMTTEMLTLDVEGTLPASRFLNFGFPKRSWEFTTLANERDRPSLALPRAQAIVDVLTAFGWRDSRPEPETEREQAPNLIQPGVLANGTVGVWLTRLSDDSGLTKMMLTEQPVEELVNQLFLRILTRQPTTEEHAEFVGLLEPGYHNRVVPADQIGTAYEERRFPYVSWSNHLNAEANVIKMKMQELVRQGPPPTRFLKSDWRERAEDAVWSLLNSPEMVLIP
ncbi:MAG: DUF1553 domain-containing protein [Fuerstiella sp.]